MRSGPDTLTDEVATAIMCSQSPTATRYPIVSAKDVGKVIGLVLALYGAFGAVQAWERKEDLRNSLGVLIAGASLFSAIEKFG